MREDAPEVIANEQRGQNWLQAALVSKRRSDAVIQATWTLIFGLGIGVGQWLPRLVWFGVVGLAVVAFFYFSVKALRAIIEETRLQANIDRGFRVLPDNVNKAA